MSACCDHEPSSLTSIEQSLGTILQTLAAVTETERVDRDRALGGVLADDVCAAVNVPPLDNSGMDGNAPRPSDLIAGTDMQLPVSTRVCAGEDIHAGDVVLTRGIRIRPQELGLAASIGCTKLTVRRRVHVAVVSTGDEMLDLGVSLQCGKLRFGADNRGRVGRRRRPRAQHHCRTWPDRIVASGHQTR